MRWLVRNATTLILLLAVAVAAAVVALNAAGLVEVPPYVAGACIVVGIAATFVKEGASKWAEGRKRKLTVKTSLIRYPPKRVADIAPGEHPRVPSLDYEPEDPLDERMDAALRERGVLLLVASPDWDPSPRAFEAVRRVYPDAPMAQPSAERLRHLLDLDPPWAPDVSRGLPWILWLDDLARYLPDGLDAAALERLLDRPGKDARVVVVATMSHADLEDATGQPSNARDVVNALRSRGGLVTASARARPASPNASALQTRYEAGREKNPHGAAVVAAAVDWKRCGMDEPIAADALETLSDAYLPADFRGEGWFVQAMEWAGAIDPRTRAPLVARTDDGGYRAADAIVAYDEGEGRRSIPPDTWTKVIGLANGEQATRIAQAATARLLSHHAMNDADKLAAAAAWKSAAEKADAADVAEGTYLLGLFYYSKGERSDAERFWRKATARQHASAAYHLGVLLMQNAVSDDPEARPDRDEAKAAFRTALAGGHAAAAHNLGVLLIEDRDFDNAEDAIRMAVRMQHVPSFRLLGMLYEVRGQHLEAEGWYRKSAEAGDAKGLRSLGALLMRQGRNDEAAVCYRQAADTGDVEAVFELGLFLDHIGDDSGAEAALSAAADQGHVPARRRLAQFLEEHGRKPEADYRYDQVMDYLTDLGRQMDATQAEFDADLADLLVGAGRFHYDYGDNEDAEESFRQAADVGAVDGAFWLAVVREEQGDEAAAAELYRRASAAEHAAASARLGVLLQESEPEEARRLFEKAWKGGDAEGAYRLGALLEKTGLDVRAEELYRAAAEALHPAASWALVELLRRQGRQPEVERWTANAAQAAYLWGSALEQRKRISDAEIWYRKAANLGDRRAASALSNLAKGE